MGFFGVFFFFFLFFLCFGFLFLPLQEKKGMAGLRGKQPLPSSPIEIKMSSW